MNVVLQDIDKDTLKPFKALAQVLNVKMKVEQKLSAFEKSVLKAKKEIEQAKKKGTLKSFRSVDELFNELEKWNILSRIQKSLKKILKN